MAELYGSAVLNCGSSPMTYEDYLGLWMNRDRALMRRSAAMVMAIGICFGDKPPRDWIRANSETEDEAIAATPKQKTPFDQVKETEDERQDTGHQGNTVTDRADSTGWTEAFRTTTS